MDVCGRHRRDGLLFPEALSLSMRSKKIEFFFRSLGGIYLVAFTSFWTQMDGLIGENGILPSRPFIDSIKSQLGLRGFLDFPTLSLFNSSDQFSHLLCLLGIVLSILLLLGHHKKLVLLLLWLIYLSISINSREFLGFQWDILLLEVGFLSIFLSNDNNSAIIWTFRLLLFKIMFCSGIVKLTSGDIRWRNLTALNFHFLTQPLPLPLAWNFSHFSPLFLKFSCIFMFFIEIFTPFLIFFNIYSRKIASFFILFLMFLIFITGNYTFFNILTALLVIFLCIQPQEKSPSWHWLFAGFYVFVSCTQVVDACRVIKQWPAWVEQTRDSIAPFRSINGYGLFQVMTTRRLEIDIQGSDSPEIESSWKSYPFKYKPGPLDRPPQWCQPHQPRLDWQMWFAALGSADENPWYLNFLVRLLQGKREVLALLGTNPFPDKPPKFIRGKLFEYHFTTEAEHEKTGDWWSREDLGLYSKPIFLRDK
jgi:hypothetical protein